MPAALSASMGGKGAEEEAIYVGENRSATGGDIVVGEEFIEVA